MLLWDIVFIGCRYIDYATGAFGAFFFTERIQLSLASGVVYISLVPMVSPFFATKVKYLSLSDAFFLWNCASIWELIFTDAIPSLQDCIDVYVSPERMGSPFSAVSTK